MLKDLIIKESSLEVSLLLIPLQSKNKKIQILHYSLIMDCWLYVGKVGIKNLKFDKYFFKSCIVMVQN